MALSPCHTWGSQTVPEGSDSVHSWDLLLEILIPRPVAGSQNLCVPGGRQVTLGSGESAQPPPVSPPPPLFQPQAQHHRRTFCVPAPACMCLPVVDGRASMPEDGCPQHKGFLISYRTT